MPGSASGKKIFPATAWVHKGTLSASARRTPTSFRGYFGGMRSTLHCCTRIHAISAREKAQSSVVLCTLLPQRSGVETTMEPGDPIIRTYWATLLPVVSQTSTILQQTEDWD